MFFVVRHGFAAYMKRKGQETEHAVIRPVASWLALAALLGGPALVLAAPPPTSLSLPQRNQAPSAPSNQPPASTPGSQPLSAPLSAPLTAPLSAPLGGPQPALQSTPPQSTPSSNSRQEAKPAEQGSGTSLRAAYDAAFQATLDNPSDPDVLVKFAELAVEFGDIEGAVSALERLLLIDDDQPEVKLELGVLYFRLGSKEAARMYLEAANKSSVASPETKERAEQYLKAEGVK
jgi:Flp pilus assembly protein TadD